MKLQATEDYLMKMITDLCCKWDSQSTHFIKVQVSSTKILNKSICSSSAKTQYIEWKKNGFLNNSKVSLLYREVKSRS